MGSTYPRDHVKVARGLLSCALPQVEVNLGEEMSAGKTAGEDSLLAAGKAWGDSEAGVDQQKSKIERSF